MEEVDGMAREGGMGHVWEVLSPYAPTPSPVLTQRMLLMCCVVLTERRMLRDLRYWSGTLLRAVQY
eukprot:3416989-Rhodomonas_salina.2